MFATWKIISSTRDTAPGTECHSFTSIGVTVINHFDSCIDIIVSYDVLYLTLL